MSGQIKDDRPVQFIPRLAIGEHELKSCLRCGATILWTAARLGDAAEMIHRKWHEEIEGQQS